MINTGKVRVWLVGLIQIDRVKLISGLWGGQGVGQERKIWCPFSYCDQQLKVHAVNTTQRSYRVLFPLRLDRLKALEDKDPTTRP
jgi:hypothetical protein